VTYLVELFEEFAMKKDDVVLIDSPNPDVGPMSDRYLGQIGLIIRRATGCDEHLLSQDRKHEWLVDLDDENVVIHEAEVSIIGIL